MANDGQKPITFRNQAGQILQATPITVVSAANQPVVPTFPTNGDATMGMNTSQINGFAHGQPQTSVTSLATQQVIRMIRLWKKSFIYFLKTLEFISNGHNCSNEFINRYAKK